MSRYHDILPESRDKMERLFDYIADKPNAKITKEEQQILERCNFADNLLRGRSSERTVAKLLKEKFDISHSTALNDIATTKYLFNSLTINDKLYGLKLLLELNMKALDKAMLKGDFRAINSLIESRAKLLDRIPDVNPSEKTAASVFILQVPNTAGRPKTMRMDEVHDLSDDDIEMIAEKVNQAMIPFDIVKALKDT